MLDFVPATVKEEHELAPEAISPESKAELFIDEADFNEKQVIPLLKLWGLEYQQEYPCNFRFGSQYYRGRLDFLVKDQKGPLCVVESKFKIRNETELIPAIDQAKSYALMLGLSSFIVASPEAFWLYSLERNTENLVKKVETENLSGQHEELKKQLMQVSGRLRPAGVS